MPRATKKSGETDKTRPQAMSKSKSSQLASGGTRNSKQKREQGDGRAAKKKTSRVKKSAVAKAAEGIEGDTTRQTRSAVAKAANGVEGATTRQTRDEDNVDTSDDQELLLADLDEAKLALKNMFARWRGDNNRQMGRKKLGERFHLSPSQFGDLADRYLVARNTGIDVQYKDLSETHNFKSFKGYTEKLRAKEPLLKALLKMALVEQREIDAGRPTKIIEEEIAKAKEPELKAFLKRALLVEQRGIDADRPKKKTIEDLEEEVAKLDVQHKEDLAKREQHEVEIAQLKEQHKAEIAKLEALHKVEIGNLQDKLSRVETRCNALKEVMTGRGKSPEFEGDVNELKKKLAGLEEKANATNTKQAELVAFSNRLAERDSKLNDKEHELAEQAKRQRRERLEF